MQAAGHEVTLRVETVLGSRNRSEHAAEDSSILVAEIAGVGDPAALLVEASHGALRVASEIVTLPRGINVDASQTKWSRKRQAIIFTAPCT